MTAADIIRRFRDEGGIIHPECTALSEKANRIQLMVFDWDGVFNAGYKNQGPPEGFSEVDSMGVNLLRFSHWLKTSTILPCAIISGQNNTSAEYMAARENFNFIFSGYKNKAEAFGILCNESKTVAENAAYLFDDVLDLSVARLCGLRMMVKRSASPLLNDFAESRFLYDYRTAGDCRSFAVREACELLSALIYDFEKMLDLRISYSAEYKEYFSQRSEVIPRKFIFK